MSLSRIALLVVAAQALALTACGAATFPQAQRPDADADDTLGRSLISLSVPAATPALEMNGLMSATSTATPTPVAPSLEPAFTGPGLFINMTNGGSVFGIPVGPSNAAGPQLVMPATGGPAVMGIPAH